MYKKELLEKKYTKIGLLAGGTGLTPMLSLGQASVLAKDGVQVNLIFSNKTKDDIFCDDELFQLSQNPNFKYYHTLTRHDVSKHGKWEGLTGRINMDML